MDLHLDAVGGLSTKRDPLWKDLGGSEIVFTVCPLVYGTFVYFGLVDLPWDGRVVILQMWHWFLEQRWVLANEGHVGPGGGSGVITSVSQRFVRQVGSLGSCTGSLVRSGVA